MICIRKILEIVLNHPEKNVTMQKHLIVLKNRLNFSIKICKNRHIFMIYNFHFGVKYEHVFLRITKKSSTRFFTHSVEFSSLLSPSLVAFPVTPQTTQQWSGHYRVLLLEWWLHLVPLPVLCFQKQGPHFVKSEMTFHVRVISITAV